MEIKNLPILILILISLCSAYMVSSIESRSISKPIISVIPHMEECESDEDCAPAACCHPSSCVSKRGAPDCSKTICTLECRKGTMDCGAGKCACIGGKCGVKWASGEVSTQTNVKEIQIPPPFPGWGICDKECKLRGYSYGVCRKGPINKVCEENEKELGETKDCRIVSPGQPKPVSNKTSAIVSAQPVSVRVTCCCGKRPVDRCGIIENRNEKIKCLENVISTKVHAVEGGEIVEEAPEGVEETIAPVKPIPVTILKTLCDDVADSKDKVKCLEKVIKVEPITVIEKTPAVADKVCEAINNIDDKIRCLKGVEIVVPQRVCNITDSERRVMCMEEEKEMKEKGRECDEITDKEKKMICLKELNIIRDVACSDIEDAEKRAICEKKAEIVKAERCTGIDDVVRGEACIKSVNVIAKKKCEKIEDDKEKKICLEDLDEMDKRNCFNIMDESKREVCLTEVSSYAVRSEVVGKIKKKETCGNDTECLKNVRAEWINKINDEFKVWRVELGGNLTKEEKEELKTKIITLREEINNTLTNKKNSYLQGLNRSNEKALLNRAVNLINMAESKERVMEKVIEVAESKGHDVQELEFLLSKYREVIDTAKTLFGDGKFKDAIIMIKESKEIFKEFRNVLKDIVSKHKEGKKHEIGDEIEIFKV